MRRLHQRAAQSPMGRGNSENMLETLGQPGSPLSDWEDSVGQRIVASSEALVHQCVAPTQAHTHISEMRSPAPSPAVAFYACIRASFAFDASVSVVVALTPSHFVQLRVLSSHTHIR